MTKRPDTERDVERRTDLRGPVRDLAVLLPGEERVAVLEAGKRGVFVALDDPDRFPLGAKLEITIIAATGEANARTEVVRKEIDPRRGVALLIVHMSPADAAIYDAILAS